MKKDYTLPQPIISNPDLPRLINSDEIQAVVRPAGQAVVKRPFTQRKNPLRNTGVLVRLNPYAQTLRRREILAEQARKEGKVTKKRGLGTKNKEFAKILLRSVSRLFNIFLSHILTTQPQPRHH